MKCAISQHCNVSDLFEYLELARTGECPHTVLLADEYSANLGPLSEFSAVAAALSRCNIVQGNLSGHHCSKDLKLPESLSVLVAGARSHRARDTRMWTLWVRCEGREDAQAHPPEIELPLPPVYAKLGGHEVNSSVFDVDLSSVKSAKGTLVLTAELHQEDVISSTLWDTHAVLAVSNRV